MNRKTRELLKYLENNIVNLNSPNFNFCPKGLVLFGSLQNFKDYVDLLFINKVIYVKKYKEELTVELEKENYIKTSIEKIANKYWIRKSTLKEFYSKEILLNIKEVCKSEEYTNHTLDYFRQTLNTRIFSFVRTDLKKTIKKQYDFIHTNGFPENTMNINRGVMTANAGDSAQLLFVSRAILIGFNCSNVDVRSSRYDSIIDFNGKLLRIQVKGLSDASISFKDRDRGGQGIDYKHERNVGKRISSQECDIYVAVDRRFGTCYIIPVRKFIDPISDDIIGKPINISSLDIYKENWTIIEEVAEHY